MDLDAIVFDAYGTLFDVHSVVARCDAFWPGRGAELSRLWRQKQLEYTWLRSLMRRYEDFESVTRDSLLFACTALGLDCGDARADALTAEYRRLAAYPGTEAALARLGGRRLAILSNGSPAMLEAVVAHAGLATLIPTVLSVDRLRIYKPDPAVYRLAEEALGVRGRRIGFVSANGWDACGAAAFGFRTFWINRTGQPAEELGIRPDHVVAELSAVADLVSA